MGTIQQKRRNVRLFVLIYFSILFTFVSPVASLNNPQMKETPAQADELSYRDIARQMALTEYGWEGKQFTCLNRLWGKESAWNPKADNPTSSAYGIAQMLGEDSQNPKVQISNGLRYIMHRYENPCNAWDFWLKNNWY